MKKNIFFVHESSFIDEKVSIGNNTKIWHFSHIQSGSTIGENCSIGQNVYVGNDVKIGNFVKIQNNVSVYEGVELEDYVFCGPSMVFTNILNPRSEFPQKGSRFYNKTLVKKSASIGANATIICGITIGKYALIGAGSVVTKDIPDYALTLGSPARITAWICACGKKKLSFSMDPESIENAECKECGRKYNKIKLIITETIKK